MASDHEQIEYGMDEVKELFDTCVFTGIIIEVDTDNDKADVETAQFGRIDDVPVFYHCEDSDVVEGGSVAFEEDDNVYILNKNGIINPNASDLKIVGFVEGLKSCVQEFYIRPTFNSFNPTYGGESIKVENDEHNETKTTVVVGDFAELCGPFTRDVNTGDEAISLNKWVAAGINPNYPGINNIFSHFTEVPEVDADYHYGYNFRTLTWYSAGKKEFEIYSPHLSPILHVNRVDWLRYDKILSECPKTVETIDGTKYDIYQVDFTDLYFPAMTRTEKLYLSTKACEGCGALSMSQVYDKYYAITVGSISGAIVQTSGNCDGYGEACAEEEPGCKAFILDAISPHILEFVMSKEQICILSNEFGQNPSYSPITIDANIYVHEQAIYQPFNGGDVCRVNTTDYPDSREYKYEMTLAPEDKF